MFWIAPFHLPGGRTELCHFFQPAPPRFAGFLPPHPPKRASNRRRGFSFRLSSSAASRLSASFASSDTRSIFVVFACSSFFNGPKLRRRLSFRTLDFLGVVSASGGRRPAASRPAASRTTCSPAGLRIAFAALPPFAPPVSGGRQFTAPFDNDRVRRDVGVAHATGLHQIKN